MRFDWNQNRVELAVEKAVEEAAARGARIVAADARRNAPKRTGKLASQIAISESKFEGGGYIVEAQGAGNYDRFYASFVELGTKNTAAQPFLRPAAHKNRRRIQRLYQREIEEQLRQP